MTLYMICIGTSTWSTLTSKTFLPPELQYPQFQQGPLQPSFCAGTIYKMRKGFSRSEFHLFQFDWYPNKTFTTHPCTQSSRLSCKKRFSVTERFSSIFITACARCPWKSVNMEEEKLYKNWEYRHVYRLPWTLNKLLHLTPIELPVKRGRLGLWVVGIRSVV